MPRRRSDRAGIGFMALWLVVWTAAIFTATWYMGAAALRGEPAASLFLAVWLIAAGFGLRNGGRKLVRLMLDGKAPRRPVRDHGWNDGIDPPADGARNGQDPGVARAQFPVSH